MTSPDPTKGLGAYMRQVGAMLTDTPLTVADVHAVVGYPDEGYIAATLIRLRDREVASEDTYGFFTRGPRWHAAARYYNWGAKP